MICRYSSPYRRAEWTMRRSTTSVTLTSSDKVRSDRFSSPPFNGYDFPLHVSPVTFEDSGTFECFYDHQRFGMIKLTTIRGNFAFVFERADTLFTQTVGY